MKRTLHYGRYSREYYVEFCDRKTLGLIVRSDLRIIARVPYDATPDEIENFIRRKWLWLQKQIAELKRYQKIRHTREYVSGESYQYLGRQYMLLVDSGNRENVRLAPGKLLLTTAKGVRNSTHNKKLLEEWYEQRREMVFKRLYLKALRLFTYDTMPQLKVRIMAKRWGSYTADGKVALNPKLIATPTEAIYYVIVHELCHVTNRKHDDAFYNELERRIPNWREIKERLEVRYG